MNTRTNLNPLPAWKAGLAYVSLLIACCTNLSAYELSGNRWPTGKNVVIEIDLPTPNYPGFTTPTGYITPGLSDGHVSLADSVKHAITHTNTLFRDIKLTGVPVSPLATAPILGDGHNTIYLSKTYPFKSTSYLTGWEDNAVIQMKVENGVILEADIILNGNTNWDSFPGDGDPDGRHPTQDSQGNYQEIPVNDIYRAVTHQLGHLLGLNDHPIQHHPDVPPPYNEIESLMGPTPGIQNNLNYPYQFTSDDAEGLREMYKHPHLQPNGDTPYTPVNAKLVNVSTRMGVGKDNDVLIGGFIISRPGQIDEATVFDNPRRYSPRPLTVAIRAIGPSMNIPGVLADTTLELHSSTGTIVATNDDWGQAANAAAISASGLGPNNPKEAVILITLDEGAYTAIIRGKNNTTGIGLLEVYAMDNGGAQKEYTDKNGVVHQYTIDNGSKLVNISSRGKVLGGDEVLIGGFIVQGNTSKKVIVRAIGPSMGIPGQLADPTLEIFNSNGTMTYNNDWKVGTQELDISLRSPVYPEQGPQPSGLSPGSTSESAVVASLAPGNYTAVVRSQTNTNGIGLVEIYDLDPEVTVR